MYREKQQIEENHSISQDFCTSGSIGSIQRHGSIQEILNIESTNTQLTVIRILVHKIWTLEIKICKIFKNRKISGHNIQDQNCENPYKIFEIQKEFLLL